VAQNEDNRQVEVVLLILCACKIIRMANKMDLVEKVAQTIGCTKADAERAVESIIDFITASLKKGEEVSVAGLGIFEAKTRAGRTGRNPRTGATIQIEAMKVPKFRASKTLKDAIK
jgi:DNA-binding protein HU-beta